MPTDLRRMKGESLKEINVIHLWKTFQYNTSFIVSQIIGDGYKNAEKWIVSDNIQGWM